MANGIKANEVPRIELLERDVKILFDEVRRLQKENESLKNKIELLEAQKAELKARLKPYEDAEKEELGFYIQSQRKALKMSVTAFSRALGISTQTLQNYEKGKGNLDNMREIVKKIKEMRVIK
jgi:DNA-binding transcriptional regulator YiaG